MTIAFPRAGRPWLCAALLSLTFASSSFAQEGVPVPCGPVSDVKDAGKYRRLTHDEFTAARVIFFMAPDTPAQLPPGDAAMIYERDDGTALLVYLDGDEACAPVKLMKDDIALFKQIRDGVVTHAAGRL